MNKIAYLDNLKIVLIALVVAHHAAQSYAPGANWLVPDPEKAPWITIFITANATFFMGLFFFISAYFLPSSYAKAGSLTLLKKKWIRLGIPTLFTLLFILAPIFYMTHSSYNFGHTWFLVQLLLYSSLYIIYKRNNPKTPPFPLSHKTLILYTFALFALTWLVNFKYPQDTWTFYHIFEPYHLPQYISLFFLGIIAFENKWLENLNRRLGYTWFSIGILALLYLAFFNMPNTTFYIFWSSLMCTSWVIGLLTLFRDYIHYNGSIHALLSKTSYGVYLLHVLPVILIQSLLLPLPWSGSLKFSATFLIGYVSSVFLCNLIRKIPGVARVL